MDACTVTFWPYRNRLIPQKPNAAPGPLNVTACFASCTKTCELPNAPTPLASLDASQYSGGNTWGNAQISCNLGSQTTYNSTMNGMYINGNRQTHVRQQGSRWLGLEDLSRISSREGVAPRCGPQRM